jgi:predicted nuclease of predicted toxin-antitoxin system
MKVLIDMNLSPEWVSEFKLHHNIDAVHWSTVGAFDAPDSMLIDWAIKNDHIIFTHDLDFGTALALTKADRPSVIQVRTQNVTIPHLSKLIFPVIKQHAGILENGGLLTVDEDKQRVRILPL